jgi:dihydroxy-acid dehydratase
VVFSNRLYNCTALNSNHEEAHFVKTLAELRSQRWFGRGPYSFSHRSRVLQNGFAEDDFSGKPVVAIVNTWSELNTCHAHLRDVAEAVKRGVWEAGGYPVELPAMSLGEIMMKPSAMLYRNLLAMETEELLRSNPVDGAVLLGGCDKTTPALLMGAISMNLPAIFVPAGPMLHGSWRGEKLGSGVDGWKYGAELRAGRISMEDWSAIERGSARTAGTCNTMGTASTMTAIAEALGLTLPGASSVPAVYALHRRLASLAGRQIVDLIWKDIKPSTILSKSAFEDAATINFSLGGSTNAAIHILALAGRAGIDTNLGALDAISSRTPVLANIMPSGKYLLEDFHEAGGLPALMNLIADRLHLERITVTGKSLRESVEGAKVINDDVIRSPANPISRESFAVLYGNLAPNGCVIKPSAASSKLLTHRGRAVVFESRADLEARIDSPELNIDENNILVMKEGGPQGGPGMPEWGMLPLPRKLLQRGVTDMVRISDARMSGTSYGTVVLHVSPESHIGGPLALVKDGDEIALDVPQRTLNLLVSEEELDRRRAAWVRPKPKYERGYGALFQSHVTQADKGCDFDFLLNGTSTPEPEIHL